MAKCQLEINIDKSCFRINCGNSGRHLQSEIMKADTNRLYFKCLYNAFYYVFGFF